MELCARCHKRVAVVYVTKIENGETVTEGICLKCAKELGIKPVNDILEKMGVSSDDIDEIADNIESLPGINGGQLDTTNSDENSDPINAAKNGYIDNIIEPAFAKQYIVSCLQTLVN